MPKCAQDFSWHTMTSRIEPNSWGMTHSALSWSQTLTALPVLFLR